MATGRSDYPNQVNNVLGFPFIFRGALDVRARAINEEMKMAATRALAELARQDVPESVERAYGDERLALRPGLHHPQAVRPARPALGGAGGGGGGDGDGRRARAPSTWTSTASELEARLGRGARGDARHHATSARSDPRSASSSPRASTSASSARPRWWWSEGIAHPILLGRPERIRETRARQLGVSLEGVTIVDPLADEARAERYAQTLYERRQRKGVTLAEARGEVRQRDHFGLHDGARGRRRRAGGGRGPALPGDDPPGAADDRHGAGRAARGGHVHDGAGEARCSSSPTPR